MRRAVFLENEEIRIEEVEKRENFPEEPEAPATVWDELDAAYQEGVNKAYEQ